MISKETHFGETHFSQRYECVERPRFSFSHRELMGADNTKLMLETFQTHLNLEIESRFWGLLTTFPSVILVTQFRVDFGSFKATIDIIRCNLRAGY